MDGWDQSRFDDALKKYLPATSKDMVTVLNSKAYFVARKSFWFTPVADKKEVSEFRGSPTVRRKREPKEKGLIVGAMVSRRLGKGGGLYGSKMRSAIKSVIDARQRSRAFIKSGWLTAIRGLDPKAEDKGKASPMPAGVAQIGQAKGSFSSATESAMQAIIRNSASTTRDRKDALNKYGMPALMRAFDDEASSMEEYIMKKNAKAAKAAQDSL